MSPATAQMPEELEHESAVPSVEEVFHRLMPILQEYNDKLSELYRDLAQLLQVRWASGEQGGYWQLFASLLCRYDTIRTYAEKFAMEASATSEHPNISFEDKRELMARQYELEEQLRQMTSLFTSFLHTTKETLTLLEAYIKQTGRGSSPIKKYLK